MLASTSVWTTNRPELATYSLKSEAPSRQFRGGASQHEKRARIYLQMTLRNPAVLDLGAISIYKWAAHTFDLFLASALKDLLAKGWADPQIAGVASQGRDITVLVEGKSQSAASPFSKAFELLCAPRAGRAFHGSGNHQSGTG